ncbi:MAG TPA: cupin domain-containing protein [Microscillaceae bacterium]|nr:cupin domain-containing protein [Microscillaceae bacterium]
MKDTTEENQTTQKEATSQEFLFGDQVAWETIDPKLKRQVLGYDDKIMLVKVAFEEGGVGQMHEHHHSQVTYVESGEFEMTIGDQTHLIKAGDSYYVPPHALHGCVCKKAGVLIDVFSPLREDFIA